MNDFFTARPNFSHHTILSLFLLLLPPLPIAINHTKIWYTKYTPYTMEDDRTPGNLIDNYDLIVKYVHAIHLLKLLCMNAHIEAFDASPNTPLGRRALFMDRRPEHNARFYFLTDFMSGVKYLNDILAKLSLAPIRIQEGHAPDNISITTQVAKVNNIRRALGLPVVNLLEDAAEYGNWEIGPDQLTLSELFFELLFRSIYSRAISELADPDDPTAIISDGDSDLENIVRRFSILGQEDGISETRCGNEHARSSCG